MSDDTQPVFPPELEHIIFHLAIKHYIKANINLTLVAKRVYDWLKPEIYQVLIPQAEDEDPDFGLPKFNLDLLQRHGEHVRSILFWYDRDSDGYDECVRDPVRCLSLCPNVVDVALWRGDTIYDEPLVDTLLSLHLTDFSFDLTWFDLQLTKHTITKPISFTFVTHLCLMGQDITLPLSKIHEYFPSITHLALEQDEMLPVQGILDCWRTQLVVLVWFMDPHPMSVAGKLLSDDPRIVVRLLTRVYVEDWYSTTVDDSNSFWRRAEREIEGRRGAE